MHSGHGVIKIWLYKTLNKKMDTGLLESDPGIPGEYPAVLLYRDGQSPWYHYVVKIIFICFAVLTYRTGVLRNVPSISDIPAAILRAELARRNEVRDEDVGKATCGSTRSGAYNTPAHVMALFLILVLSTLGI